MDNTILMLDHTRLLSAWGVMDTRDPGRACTHLSQLFRPHRVRLHHRADAVHFQHNRVELGGLSINMLHYGEEVTIDARNNLADSYLVKFTLNGASEVTQQRNHYRTRKGTVCVLNPSLPLNDHMSEDMEMLIVQFEGRELRDLLAEELGFPLRRPLEFQPLSCSLSGGAASFSRLVRTACEDLADGRSDLLRQETGRQLGRLMMQLLLLEMPHSYSEQLCREDTRPAPACVRLAEDYVHAHLDESILLAGLCTVSGASPRTLQQAFRKYRGLSPMEYIRNARLEQAHRRLADIDDGATVSQIAMDCGFSHLSRFARAYRERFGELPSHTRRFRQAHLRRP